MYICNCGKGHKLSDEQYNLVDGKQELRLRHDCGFDIIIGGDDHGPWDEESGMGGISMYSFNTKDLLPEQRDERLKNAKLIVAEIVPIRMKCGHDANWRGFGPNFCHKECAWDENGHQKDKLAWEENYDYMKANVYK